MKDLIEKESFSRFIGQNGLRSEALSSILMRILRLNDLNELYKLAYSESPLEFINRVLDELNVSFSVNEEVFKKIPKDGPFITVSNHPYGGIDGLILLKIFLEQNPNFKVLVNYVLQQIDPLKNSFIEVNPFEKAASQTEENAQGVRNAITHIRNGNPLGIFPAGEVSTFYNGKVRDKRWSTNSIRLIKSLSVPIVPVYFSGSNSNLFHLLGSIDPNLRTAKLPSELLNKKNKSIEVRVGYPIEVEEQQRFNDIQQFARYLRVKTYSLGSSVELKRFYQYSLRRKKKQQPIASEISKNIIVKEISEIPEEHLLFSSGEYDIYCTSFRKIPNVIYEIARLREITYRLVGEGTNQQMDIDEFDLYYNHLLIWDRVEERIVGGYRIGKCQEIMDRYGKSGLYINQLFRIDEKFNDVLDNCLELGRSYIVEDYQKKPLPLFLLWKGILCFLINNPSYRYLIGPVSLSNQFSEFSKSLIIEFLNENYSHHRYVKHFKPRNKYKIKTDRDDLNTLLEFTLSDLRKLDQFIEQIEPKHLRVPVLFKKYLKQNAKVLGFNQDPKFSNAIDGLLLLDLFEVPNHTINKLMKELFDEKKIEEFNVRKNVSAVECAVNL